MLDFKEDLATATAVTYLAQPVRFVAEIVVELELQLEN